MEPSLGLLTLLAADPVLRPEFGALAASPSKDKARELWRPRSMRSRLMLFTGTERKELSRFQIVRKAGASWGVCSFSFVPNAIWFGAYKRTIVARIIDGIVHVAITGAIFAYCWPARCKRRTAGCRPPFAIGA